MERKQFIFIKHLIQSKFAMSEWKIQDKATRSNAFHVRTKLEWFLLPALSRRCNQNRNVHAKAPSFHWKMIWLCFLPWFHSICCRRKGGSSSKWGWHLNWWLNTSKWKCRHCFIADLFQFWGMEWQFEVITVYEYCVCVCVCRKCVAFQTHAVPNSKPLTSMCAICWYHLKPILQNSFFMVHWNEEYSWNVLTDF